MATRGRQPKYTPDRVAKICKALESGETDLVAAKIGGIAEGTFYRWIEEKNEFREAVKAAKGRFEEWQLNGILADAKKGLKTLIMGQEYEEIKTEYEQDPRNPGEPRIRKQTRTTKRIPPNATAVIFALCNRDSENWQNRVSNDISGKIETESKPGVTLANVPDELLAKVIDAINGK